MASYPTAWAKMRFADTREVRHTLLTFPKSKKFTTGITPFMDGRSKWFVEAPMLAAAMSLCVCLTILGVRSPAGCWKRDFAPG